MTVYLDLLLAINFVFNLALLTVSGWLGLQRFSASRYCLAAGAGTGFWLIFFFCPQYIFINWLCRILGGLAMAFLAWQPQGLRSLLSRTALLVVSGQLMGGGIYSLAFALGGTPLGSSDALPLAIVMAGAGMMLVLAAWWAGKVHTARQLKGYIGQATIHFQDKVLTVQALLDSGNSLRHPVNSWPVLVLERRPAQDLFPQDLLAWLDEPQHQPPLGLETRIALIPFKSVGGAGLLAAVRPDKVLLKGERGGAVLTQVYVAVRPKQQLPLQHQALAFPVQNWKEGVTG